VQDRLLHYKRKVAKLKDDRELKLAKKTVQLNVPAAERFIFHSLDVRRTPPEATPEVAQDIAVQEGAVGKGIANGDGSSKARVRDYALAFLDDAMSDLTGTQGKAPT
jgi:hypothetical protein